jgi:hypothetical protein
MRSPATLWVQLRIVALLYYPYFDASIFLAGCFYAGWIVVAISGKQLEAIELADNAVASNAFVAQVF